jgi:hypothetical protein
MSYIPSLHRRTGYRPHVTVEQNAVDAARRKYVAAYDTWLLVDSPSKGLAYTEIEGTNSALTQLATIHFEDTPDSISELSN